MTDWQRDTHMPAQLFLILGLIVRVSNHCIFEGTVEYIDEAESQQGI
jgi:hypothetical protein